MCAKIAINQEDIVFLQPDRMRKTAQKALEKLGLSAENARIIADVMVMADLRGVDTHGIRTLPIYARRYQGGGLNSAPHLRVIEEREAVALMDGDNGLGHIVGYRAMELAIRKARQAGIGMVSVKNSNHFGAAAYYSMMAQQAGMIGLALANAQARLAPTGGITPCYGSNPWSLAFPAQESGIPIVLDMASSVVANSNILMARELGTKILITWALTAEGEETDDPNKAVLPLPFGGYKGYAIALAIEILAGVLPGSAIGKEVDAYDSVGKGQNVGQLFIAIDVESLTDRHEYNARYQSLTEDVKASRLAKGSEWVFLPGEKEYECYQNRLGKGVPISKKYIREINRLCEALGLEDLL